MSQITFSPNDVQALSQLRYHHPDPCVRRHLDILWFKHHACTHAQIATLADCSLRTVQRTLASFRDGGLDALRQTERVRHPSRLDDHRDQLLEQFRQQPPRSVKHARQLIFERTGLRRGLSQVRRFLHRLGLKPRRLRTVPVPPKVSLQQHAQSQKAFLENELEPRLREAREGRRQLYFGDAAHFVFGTLLGGVLWCLTRLFVRAASGRQRFNVLGALDAVSHRLVRVSNHSYINAGSVCELLRALAQAALPGVPITLVLDNARYQKCAVVADLARELGVELLYLPSYSPNLNLIERLWRFVKGECLHTEYHANYEQFHTAIEGCLNELHTKHKTAVDSLLSHNFQTFDDVTLMAA